MSRVLCLRGYLRNFEQPSPTTFKTVFMVVKAHTEKLAPHPPSARGLLAWKQAPPSAAVAAARGLLSLSHGQVPQRGAAAAAATAAAPSRRLRPHRLATSPARSGPPSPTVSACDWHSREAAPVRPSHWLDPLVSPTIARHCLRLPEKPPSYWRRLLAGGGRGTRSGRFRSIAAAQRREGGRRGGNIWPAPPRACVVRPPAPPPAPPPRPPARAPRSLFARSLPRCVWQAAAAAGLLPWGAVESGASSLRRAPPAASGGGWAGGRGQGERATEPGLGGGGAGREGGGPAEEEAHQVRRRRRPGGGGRGGGGDAVT